MTKEEVRKTIKENIELRNAPGLLRLAFHDAGTYSAKEKNGGVGGSITMLSELAREENDGLAKSATLIKKLKEIMPEVSLADLIAMAGAVSVEISGGPYIEVELGREDKLEIAPEGRLPDENEDAESLRITFKKMGFTPKEMVVLTGAHTLGDARDLAFTEERLSFKNDYFQLLLKDLPSHLGRFRSDTALLEDEELKSYVIQYAEDQNLFFTDFTKAFQKMVNLGHK